MDNSNQNSPETNALNEKYLEFIQSAISRMAQNSFQAKTWCITILSAILAFYLKQDDEKLKIVSIFASFMVVIIFGAMDTYYLYLERGYRKLYNIAAKLETSNPAIRDFDMRIPKISRGVKSYFGAFFSLTTGLIYCVILIMLIVLVNYM